MTLAGLRQRVARASSTLFFRMGSIGVSPVRTGETPMLPENSSVTER